MTKKLAFIQFIALIVAIALAFVGYFVGPIWYLGLVAAAVVTVVGIIQIVYGIVEKQAWGIIAGVLALLTWILAAGGLAGLIVGLVIIGALVALNFILAKKDSLLPTIKM